MNRDVFITCAVTGSGATHDRSPVANNDEVQDILRITRATTEKLHDFAFKLARKRKARGCRGTVTCVDKANVFRSMAFFRKIFDERAALNADIEEAREVRDKIELMKGVMQWDLEREFNSRVTVVSHSLQESGEALIAAQRSRRKIDETMRTEPQRYAALSDRVDELSPRVEAMKARVEDSLEQQRAFLRDIAVDELQAQKNRLDIYTIQARFALAAIYDLATAAEDEAGQ